MKATLEIQRTYGIDPRNVEDLGGGVGLAEGSCPGCGAEPFRVRCSEPSEVDGRMRADSRCVDCGDAVGYVFVESSTIFGADEDAAMLLHARARVYW